MAQEACGLRAQPYLEGAGQVTQSSAPKWPVPQQRIFRSPDLLLGPGSGVPETSAGWEVVGR